MFEQLDLLENCIGAAGLLLVVNGVISIFSSSYYEFFSRIVFIEPFSDVERQRLRERIKNDHQKSRYAIGAFTIFFGLTAIAWALGLESALGWPFNLLF